MAERGGVNNRKRAEQGRDFTGLVYPGFISPTDIDGFIDFKNKVFIFMEAKHINAEGMTVGQMYAFERLVDSAEQSGKHALGIILNHDTPETEQIDFAKSEVAEYRSKGEWIIPKKKILVRKLIDSFLKKYFPQALTA